MLYNHLKTVLLLASLSSIIIGLGAVLGGSFGIMLALGIALISNIATYYYGDKLVLHWYKAQPLPTTADHKALHAIVQELTYKMHLPMPRLWLIISDTPNAFATGRSPTHASIAVTSRILEILKPHELRAVIAHELAHIKNRDILVSTIAAIMATMIMYLAEFIKHSVCFFSFGSSRGKDEKQISFLSAIAIAICAPLAATLLQLAVSRSREYLADETGAHHCQEPLALAAALKKLEEDSTKSYKNHTKEPMAASTMGALGIINPLIDTETVVSFFQTHPPIKRRIARLETIHQKMF